MTEQVHSLQLKIDAAAAEAGSKRFTAALSAVKKAVSDLDRAADGTFAKLANHRPEFDVTPLRAATTEANRLSTALAGTGSASDRAAATIQRTALASASAVRLAEQATQRLALRMGDLGDTQGVASLNAALAQMKTQLVDATSTLDVRRAKSQFDDLRSGLLQATVAAEYAQGEQAQLARELEQTGRAAQQQAEALSRLRAAHDPLFAASQRYSTALSEIDSLVSANMVSEAQASAMRERAAATYLAMGSAADTFAGQARNGAMAAQQVGFQLNDIGVMLAGGMSPLSIAVTQGTQLAQTFQGLKGSTSILSTLAGGFAAMFSPVSLVTIGVIALGAAIVQWMTSGSDSTQDFASALAEADSAISNLRQVTDTFAGVTIGSMVEGYGRVNAELQSHIDKLIEIARLEAVQKTTNDFNTLGGEYLGGFLTTDVDDMRIAFETTNGILSSIGGVGGLLSMALGAFSEGGVSTSPVGFASMPASAFRHAPHFAQGTPNTSGIPAVLHPNEAVIPLSRGRKIPVEMGDSAGGGTIIHAPQTINIQTPDADSFRRSQKQIAADMARAGQRAVSQNG